MEIIKDITVLSRAPFLPKSISKRLWLFMNIISTELKNPTVTVVTSTFTDLFSSRLGKKFEDTAQQSFIKNTFMHHVLDERHCASKCLRTEKGDAVVYYIELKF